MPAVALAARRSNECRFGDEGFVEMLLCEGDGDVLRAALSQALCLKGSRTKQHASVALLNLYQRHLRTIASLSLSNPVAVKLLQLLHAVTNRVTADVPFHEARESAVSVLRRGLAKVSRECSLCDHDACVVVDHCKSQIFVPAKLLRFCVLRDSAVSTHSQRAVLQQPPVPLPLEEAETLEDLEKRGTEELVHLEEMHRDTIACEGELLAEHLNAACGLLQGSGATFDDLATTFQDVRKTLCEADYAAVMKSLSYTIKKEMQPGDEIVLRMEKLEEALNTLIAKK